MKKLAILAAAVIAGPAFADGHAATGDAAAGEKVFRKCAACHVVVDADGNTLAGKRAKTGPNLYGIAGRTMGSVEGFKYSSLLAAGVDAGVVFTEELFVAYVADPTKAAQEATGAKGRSKMAKQRLKGTEGVDLYAYLASLAAE